MGFRSVASELPWGSSVAFRPVARRWRGSSGVSRARATSDRTGCARGSGSAAPAGKRAPTSWADEAASCRKSAAGAAMNGRARARLLPSGAPCDSGARPALATRTRNRSAAAERQREANKAERGGNKMEGTSNARLKRTERAQYARSWRTSAGSEAGATVVWCSAAEKSGTQVAGRRSMTPAAASRSLVGAGSRASEARNVLWASQMSRQVELELRAQAHALPLAHNCEAAERRCHCWLMVAMRVTFAQRRALVRPLSLRPLRTGLLPPGAPMELPSPRRAKRISLFVAQPKRGGRRAQRGNHRLGAATRRRASIASSFARTPELRC